MNGHVLVGTQTGLLFLSHECSACHAWTWLGQDNQWWLRYGLPLLCVACAMKMATLQGEEE